MISVVIPVYNVEPYIEKCIRSIMEQTYTDLEIIPVDDGSADRSMEICEALAKEDPRIKVIRKEHTGSASTRNAGLDAAKGEYIGIVDSDDYIEPGMYEALLKAAEESKASIVGGGVIVTEFSGKITTVVRETPAFYTQQEAMREFFLRSGNISASASTKLYRREVFDTPGVRFNPNVIHEDTEAMPRFLHAAPRGVYILDRAFYHYIKHKESLSTSKHFSLRGYRFLESMTDYRKMCRAHYPDILDIFDYYVLVTTYEMFLNLSECVDRDQFKKQEHEMRRRLFSLSLRCLPYRFVRKEHMDTVKSALYRSLRGMYGL